MGHISIWSMLMMLIYWVKDKYHKNTETLLVTSKEVSLEVHAEKTKNMFMSHHQTNGQNVSL
jgi:hypothetical protein